MKNSSVVGFLNSVKVVKAGKKPNSTQTEVKTLTTLRKETDNFGWSFHAVNPKWIALRRHFYADVH